MTISNAEVLELKREGRHIEAARRGDEALGPLKDLPGLWISEGRGWNMIALPFVSPGNPPYRLLVNQYDEELTFSLVDKAVPNRGISRTRDEQTDQFVVTLDYEQVVHQIAAADFPESGLAGPECLAIHHEPGLFLHMLPNPDPDFAFEYQEFDVGRLATVPHGDVALALGAFREVAGKADIPEVNGLPIGVEHNLEGRYLAPYNHFHVSPFKGAVTDPQFGGFDPVHPHTLLVDDVEVSRTTVLELDTSVATGGVRNIPFIVKQANAVSMKSTFWIEELADGTLRLKYLQIVMLDFFARGDGLPGAIGWPHVSINTLVPAPPDFRRRCAPDQY